MFDTIKTVMRPANLKGGEEVVDEDAKTLLCTKIDTYYHYSFRLPPEQCQTHFVAVLDELEKFSYHLNAAENEMLQKHLVKMLTCFENQDYVQLRDILYYAIKPMVSADNKVITQ